MPRRCNIGILAHIDAGKTTVTEHLLHLGGAVRRPGSVDAGTTVTDWMVDEQERGITITSAASTFTWGDAEVTLVDTPGHVDFTIEVERSLRVIDGVVLVISGPDGVQAQTETVWAQRARAQVPAIAFINKLDVVGVDVDALLAQLGERLGVTPVPLQVVRQVDEGWRVLEVLGGKRRVATWRFEGEGGAKTVEIGEEKLDELDEVARLEALEGLVDAVASHDDVYAERVLAGAQPTALEHLRALRLAVAAGRVLPVLFGVARHHLGLGPLADAIVALLPDASERVVEIFPVVPEAPPQPVIGRSLAAPCAYVFKTEPRRNGVRLAYLRMIAGAIEAGTPLVRTPDGQRFDRLQLGQVTGREVDPLPRLELGQIGVLIAVPDEPLPRTGDTLGSAGLPYTLERLRSPEPVLEVPVEAADPETHQQIVAALALACEDDPSLRLGTERETGRLLLAGMGELHLEVALDRVRRDLGVSVVAGRPQIRRRFVMIGPGTGEATVHHPTGRARVRIVVTVTPTALVHGPAPIGMTVPDLERPDWRGAVLSGLEAAAGMDGASATPLLSGHLAASEVDLSGPDIVPIMLRDAAEWAALRALEAAGLAAVEPWARVVVTAPDAAVGRLIGDLARRRARLKGSESRGAVQLLTAEVPLVDLIGYASDLRSMTGGRGQFSLTPLGYRSDERSAEEVETI